MQWEKHPLLVVGDDTNDLPMLHAFHVVLEAEDTPEAAVNEDAMERVVKIMREDKQKRIAKETIEIYAPLANRLGISSIKWELEDLCLRYLEPDTYYDLVESVKQKRKERQVFIQESIDQIHKKLVEAGMKVEISGRAKHFYSIYKKMKRDHKDISEIYDLSAVRVLVESVKDCYGVLGIIHGLRDQGGAGALLSLSPGLYERPAGKCGLLPSRRRGDVQHPDHEAGTSLDAEGQAGMAVPGTASAQESRAPAGSSPVCIEGPCRPYSWWPE